MEIATLMQDGTALEAQRADVAVSRSRTPAIYVPRRSHIGGLAGVPAGAAIVGTPQGDGMVAIDVEMEPEVEPQEGIWNHWTVVAAARHLADDEETARVRQTRLVSEAALVEVGQFVGGQVLLDNTAKRVELSRWIQAGRADFVVERPFPHQS
jgi:hypothetical protein